MWLRASRPAGPACRRCGPTFATLSPADVVETAVGMYEREGARLTRSAREVELVGQALRGHRFVPRL